MSRAKNKSLKWWIIGIVGFCCVGGLAAGLIGVGPWDAPEMSRRLPELMEESESLGYPMVSTDLLPIQEVSDEENAAPDLKELASSLGTYPDPWAELLKEDPESSEYQNMEKLVETIEPDIDKIVAVVNEKAIWYTGRSYDVNVFFNPLAGSNRGVSNLGKFLVSRARFRVEKGDTEGAFSDFEAALKLMHLMHQEPAGGSSSGSSRLASLTTSWAPRIAESIQDEPAELRRLAGLLDQYEIKFDPRESLKVEFYQMLVSSRNFGQMLDPGNMPVNPSDTDVVPTPDPGVTGPPRGFMERVSMAAICEVFNNLMRMLDDQGDLREDWGDRAYDYLDEVQDSERVSFMLASVQAGIIETVLRSIQKRAARFAATRSLIDVLIFRAENGRVPTSLDEAGALRMDPFTRDSLRAHLAEDEIRIWSLGIDKTDQNGVPTSSRGPRDDFVIWPSALSQKYYDDLYSED